MSVGECADETHTCDLSVTRGVVALVGSPDDINELTCRRLIPSGDGDCDATAHLCPFWLALESLMLALIERVFGHRVPFDRLRPSVHITGQLQ